MPPTTSECAAIRLRAPMTAPSRTVQWLASTACAPMCTPCTTQPCATVAPGPTSTGMPGGACSTQQSCTLAPSRTMIGAKSARMTALNHTDAPASTWTSRRVHRCWFNAVVVPTSRRSSVRGCQRAGLLRALHAPPGIPCDVGPGATVAHGVWCTGCTWGRRPCSPTTAPSSTARSSARAASSPRISWWSAARRSPTKCWCRLAREGAGGDAGTGAQMWVETNPGAYQDLAAAKSKGA